ncbi:MAG TPA: orotidine-5'-phosphate decarboxylase, partial [Candidatus Paceibacterota bacterium]|nr:orotidine-5'-phosphate decarboxylase [Candidatus Paceibacterota bacterium]
MSTILNKFDERAKKVNSLVCVGLDAEISKLPEKFKALEFPQFEFNKFIIEETHEFAAAYKPNSAFYEAQGEQGMKELKMTVDHLKENYPDIFTILDAKRADIGNTNKGYVDSIYDWMGFDSVTVNPYLGFEAISPFTDREDKVAIV